MDKPATAFKLLTAAEWAAFDREGRFAGAPVDRADGYIHLSTADQVAETAAKHFAGQTGLVVAEIDLAALGDAVRWEPSRGGQLFPHVYGALERRHILGLAPNLESRNAMTEDRIKPFEDLYADPNSSWGGHSGGGSDANTTLEYRMFLERFMRMNDVRSVVDIGCGDWQFSRFVDWRGIRYNGFDVVEPVVARNRAAFGSEMVSFDVMPTELADLPDADLLVMKDVLQHLPDHEIARFRKAVFPRYRTCLLTNSYRKQDTPANIDIDYGGFRCLDLTAAPYDLDGVYVLEFGSLLWERIRTLLHRPA